jgi:O-acetyl-ADP-ribose deacetylase (regulator of RNase III)
MNKINYLKDDATYPQTKGTKIICHICNDLGAWGKGFVLAISKRWSEPEADYRKWHRSKNDFYLGNVHFIKVEEYLYVANMIGQRGIKTDSKGHPIRYEAVRKCLIKVERKAQQLNASIHMPRIGCGLAGGKWEKIEAIIEDVLLKQNLNLYIYDYE